MKHLLKTSLSFALFITFLVSHAQQNDLKKIKGLDQYMAKTMKDWNTPGVAVGIVKNGKLIFSKGFGYADYGKKRPMTPSTLFMIASNTKLFTSISAGFLVADGTLEWDEPIKDFVPSIKFYDANLNNSVTLRDMLSHRTGISRHDLIWYKSPFTRAELFDKLQYLEPSQTLRQGFLYNNLMYAAVGEIIELKTKKRWEDFVSEKILVPLDMKNTVFNAIEMKKAADYGIPYNEKIDTTTLYEIPIYQDSEGMGPCGSMISNVNDMSHWLIALMNKGQYNGKQVLPESAIDATLEPAMALSNGALKRGYTEILNPVYGMGRQSVSYRGHQLLYHGGDMPGFHSQISYMPQDNIGVIVAVIGDHSQPLYNIISYNIYEMLLGMSQIPWSERRLTDIKEGKKISKEGRSKATVGQIKDTKPSHPLQDYVGEFDNPAYGSIVITKKDENLQFTLHDISLPLSHYHYDRFDTPNDQDNGLYSILFSTSSQGEIGSLLVTLDEAEVKFTRKADSALSKPELLATYVGKYKLAQDTFEVILKNNNLYLVFPGTPLIELIPSKPNFFLTKEYPDYSVEFLLENGKVKSIKQKDPSGEYIATKI